MTTNEQDNAKAMEETVDATTTSANEENGAKRAGQMDQESRDADDGNACLMVEGKTEVWYGLMQLGSRWEGAAETAKRTVNLLNGKTVRDHTSMVTRASALLTGGQHTGLAQFERTVSLVPPLQKGVDGLTLFRGGGICGSTFYMLFPHGSNVGCIIMDLLTQTESRADLRRGEQGAQGDGGDGQSALHGAAARPGRVGQVLRARVRHRVRDGGHRQHAEQCCRESARG